MWKSLMSSRFASRVLGWVSLPKARQQQQELDLQRLFILTQIHKAAAKGKSVNMQQLLYKSQSLEPPEVRRQVESELQRQVAVAAWQLHSALSQAGDPAPAAAALTAAHERVLRRREREASGLSKLLRGITGQVSARQPASGPVSASEAAGGANRGLSSPSASGYGTNGDDSVGSRASGMSTSSSSRGSNDGGSSGIGAAGTPGPGDDSWPSPSYLTTSGGDRTGGGCIHIGNGGTGGPHGGGGGGGVGATGALTQQALAEAMQRRLGFRLELGPSTVPHREAGTGLFLRGEARAGTVVAIFPGVLYGRTQLAHMPNFPKVDTANPYLSCRYDQSIVDSKPWGHGDPGPPPTGSGPEPEQRQRSGQERGQGQDQGAGTAVAAAAAGAPPGRPWWTWAGPLSSALSYLEGRHPLALAHFVNHPGKGQESNVLEASLDLRLDLLERLGAEDGEAGRVGGEAGPGAGGRGPGHAGAEASEAPGGSPSQPSLVPALRAYLPCLQPPLEYDPFGDDEEDGDEDEEEDDEEEGKGKGKHAGRPRRSPGELRPEALLTPPAGVVRLLVLVTTRGLVDGEELLQNYRMNPHVARPEWYVVHDAEAEQRRWAKVKALDLGFRGKGKGQAGAGAGPPAP